MPYFYRNEGGKNDINLLFIHIPKTGGTSFEKYMSKRYDIPLDNKSLFNMKKGETSTYQHFTLQNIWKRRKEFGIHEDGLRIIAFVRNPYDRVISDLFFWKLAKKGMSADQVAEILQKYLKGNYTYDNHRLPQADFILDSSGNIWKDLEIIRLENLKDGLAQIGFDDFNRWDFANPEKKEGESMDYSKYLNSHSILLINRNYAQDFVLLGYEMMNPSEAEGFTSLITNDSDQTSFLWWIFIVSTIVLYILIKRFGKSFRRLYRG
jgi:hypothetical protein